MSTLSESRAPPSPSMTYSEKADPFGAIDREVTKILRTSVVPSLSEDAKLSGRRIKRIASTMKTTWDVLLDDVKTLKVDRDRLSRKEKDYDALVDKARREDTLLKFRHIISVFRKRVVAKKMEMVENGTFVFTERNSQKRVEKIDRASKKRIAVFDSLAAACKVEGMSETSIRNRCNGKVCRADKYVYRRVWSDHAERLLFEII